MRTILASLTVAGGLLLFAAAPQAHAVSKEIIQLQTQVQQLQDSCSTCSRRRTSS